MVANQALFIYVLLNFAVDGLVVLLYVKIAIGSRRLQFAKAISRSILRGNIAMLPTTEHRI